MSDETFDDMPLAKVLHDWLEDIGWDAEQEISKDRESSRVIARVNMSGQSYRVYIETEEPRHLAEVRVYGPINVPPERMDIAARVLNRVNTTMVVGRLAVDDDDEANPVQFRASIDVEGSILTIKQIYSMLSAGHASMAYVSAMIAVVALTERSLEECWAELQGHDDPEPELEHRVLQ